MSRFFADEELDEEQEPDFPAVAPAGNEDFQGLDAKCQQLYTKLISKESWSFEEMEELCSGLQLMPGGAVETINDWANDNVGAPLIEDGSTVFVDIEIAEELAEMQKQGQPT